MKEIQVAADVNELDNVIAFVEEQMDAVDCSMKAKIQLNVAVEEIFVNIAHYAYEESGGSARIQIQFFDNPPSVRITFLDHGIPYDPLKKEDPDIHQDIGEREAGGLGIYMVKNSMDEVTYEYSEGQNILTIVKKLQ